jgi:hypothetical protein
MFPPVPAFDSNEFELLKCETERKKEGHLVIEGWSSLFEKIHTPRPMDEVLCAVALREKGFLDFLDRLAEYWRRVVGFQIAKGVDADIALRP